ncbi:MAG: hypothetical protein NT076_01355 [Candidatus Pacearchaeota archaeon]|nr:hypothetical protein [Candidatus Pacearchaeota archaeon]
MISWIILVCLVIVIFFVMKMRHMGHRTYILILLLFLVFTYATVSGVIKKNNIDVTNFSGMVTAGKLYFNWLGQIFGNVKDISGDVVKMDWVGNSTLK